MLKPLNSRSMRLLFVSTSPTLYRLPSFVIIFPEIEPISGRCAWADILSRSSMDAGTVLSRRLIMMASLGDSSQTVFRASAWVGAGKMFVRSFDLKGANREGVTVVLGL